MLDKKIEFDLSILENPFPILIDIIEKAGYTHDSDESIGDSFYRVNTIEIAKTKKDISKFKKAISKTIGIKFKKHRLNQTYSTQFTTEEVLNRYIFSIAVNFDEKFELRVKDTSKVAIFKYSGTNNMHSSHAEGYQSVATGHYSYATGLYNKQ